MKIKSTHFGSIIIDGVEYKKDIILDRGKILKRDKKDRRSIKTNLMGIPL